MKILDLLERQIDTVISPDAKYRGKFKNKNLPDDGRTGFFSRVADDKKDPHMVVKSTIKPQYSDGYHYYIKQLIEKDLIDTNIHFPRIYNVKRIEDKNGYNVYKYQMEKLVKFLVLDIDLQKAVLENNFNYDKGKVELEIEQYGAKGIAIQVADMLDEGARGKTSVIKSSSLMEALKVLNMIKEENSMLTLDIHISNFMVRMTPSGPQIVLTDPFS